MRAKVTKLLRRVAKNLENKSEKRLSPSEKKVFHAMKKNFLKKSPREKEAQLSFLRETEGLPLVTRAQRHKVVDMMLCPYPLEKRFATLTSAITREIVFPPLSSQQERILARERKRLAREIALLDSQRSPRYIKRALRAFT